LKGNREAVNILLGAIRAEKSRRPFQIDAMVILPDHIHAIWTLPSGDADYSIRWRNIKRSFTQTIAIDNRPVVFGSRQRKGEQAIWQSFRVLLTPLTYIHVGSVDFGNTASVMKKILTATSNTFITIPSNIDW
jgi:REP element-mobilizing transposase RayT